MNLATAFAAAADAHAAKTAVYWGPSELTYADLRRLANNVTAHLRSSLEVKPGDRVGLWMRNCPEFLHALFGILQTGAVVVPINNNLKPPEVQFLVEDAGMDLLVTDETLRAAAESLLVKRPSLRLLFAETFASFPENPHPAIADCGEDDLAVIVYTSGTTGKPRSHAFRTATCCIMWPVAARCYARWTRIVLPSSCRCSTATCSPWVCCCP